MKGMKTKPWKLGFVFIPHWVKTTHVNPKYFLCRGCDAVVYFGWYSAPSLVEPPAVILEKKVSGFYKWRIRLRGAWRFTCFSHNTENLELYIFLRCLLTAAPLGSFIVRETAKSILLAGGCAFSWNTVHPIWYPSVCFQQLDLRWNVLCNVWAIWQLFIKRHTLTHYLGFESDHSMNTRERTKSSWCYSPNFLLGSWNKTAALGHNTSK